MYHWVRAGNGKPRLTWDAGVAYTLVCALFMATHTTALSEYAAEGNVLILAFFQLSVLAIVSALVSLGVHGDLHWPTLPITWEAL